MIKYELQLFALLNFTLCVSAEEHNTMNQQLLQLLQNDEPDDDIDTSQTH